MFPWSAVWRWDVYDLAGPRAAGDVRRAQICCVMLSLDRVSVVRGGCGAPAWRGGGAPRGVDPLRKWKRLPPHTSNALWTVRRFALINYWSKPLQSSAKKSHKWVVVLWRPCVWEVCFCLCETGARGACREGERNDEEIKVEIKEKQMWCLSSIGPTYKNKIYLRYFQIFFRYAYRDCIGSFGDVQHLELFHPLFLYCDIYSWVEL